jgi:3'(2'), 5'-bisphosphate nucleotidase
MVAQVITPTAIDPAALQPETAVSKLLLAAAAGGRAILASTVDVPQVKFDGSPVTLADIASDAAIRSVLHREFGDIQIISEESLAHDMDFDGTRPFILVDPLDGTKDYTAGTGEYAVCVALILDRRPVAGVILAPSWRRAWTGAREAHQIELSSTLEALPEGRQLIHVNHHPAHPVLLRSQFHRCELADQLVKLMPGASVRGMGAALKFGLLASGEATLYPRDVGSMEWDTAAGEAILMAAGGVLIGRTGGTKLYGKVENGFANGPFIAGCCAEVVERARAQCSAF